MSDRDPNNEPLFQNMDEQERIYAPEEIPGNRIVPDERDRGEGVGETPAQVDREDEVVPSVAVIPGAGGITGSSGGAAGTINPGVVPILPVDENLDPDNEREARRREERE